MTIFWINVASTWFLVGLIWLIQIVHYPLFGYVGTKEFITFHENHKIRITPVVGIVMIAELVTAVIIIFQIPKGIPITILKIAAVPSKASVVIALTQKPRKPI